jgi:hypothetical protein
LPSPDLPPAALARLSELRQELEALHAQIRGLPVGSPERDALVADRIGEVAGQAIALSEELEG